MIFIKIGGDYHNADDINVIEGQRPGRNYIAVRLRSGRTVDITTEEEAVEIGKALGITISFKREAPPAAPKTPGVRRRKMAARSEA